MSIRHSQHQFTVLAKKRPIEDVLIGYCPRENSFIVQVFDLNGRITQNRMLASSHAVANFMQARGVSVPSGLLRAIDCERLQCDRNGNGAIHRNVVFYPPVLLTDRSGILPARLTA